MTTSKFRKYVREVASLILADHKWRKATVQFSSRHIGRSNVGCILLSGKRVWWFLSAKNQMDESECTDLMKNYHSNSFDSDYSFLGSTFLPDNPTTYAQQKAIVDIRSVADTILKLCKTKK